MIAYFSLFQVFLYNICISHGSTTRTIQHNTLLPVTLGGLGTFVPHCYDGSTTRTIQHNTLLPVSLGGLGAFVPHCYDGSTTQTIQHNTSIEELNTETDYVVLI